MTDREFLNQRVLPHIRVTFTECWEWARGTDSFGYGKVRYKGEAHTLHRLMYRLYKGEVPKGLCVCHSCDNPKCCNPQHLWLGTRAENNQDMWGKGRGRNGGVNKPIESPRPKPPARTHCIHGHLLHESNLEVRKSGRINCRKCKNISARDAYRRKRKCV
jgi:hypothetical protein